MRETHGATCSDGVAPLYGALARYQWLRRRCARARPGQALEMHKRLAPPVPEARGPIGGVAGLHDWMRELLAPAPGEAVLDVGCGFGATILSWAPVHRGPLVGLGADPYQVRRARAEARRLGLAGRCEFRLQSYDDPIEGAFDGILSVEALFHSPDLERTLRNLARAAKPGARLLAVEDVARDDLTARLPQAAALRGHWRTTRLHTLSDWEAALERAGFERPAVVDLTAQVHPRPARRLDTIERRLRLLRALCPLRGVRLVADAFLGGLCLERLYAAGAMRYVALRAEFSGTPT